MRPISWHRKALHVDAGVGYAARPPARAAPDGEPAAAVHGNAAARRRDGRTALAVVLSGGLGLAVLGGARPAADARAEHGPPSGHLPIRVGRRPPVLLAGAAVDAGGGLAHVFHLGRAGHVLLSLLSPRP